MKSKIILRIIQEIFELDDTPTETFEAVQLAAIKLICQLDFAEEAKIYDEQDGLQIYFNIPGFIIGGPDPYISLYVKENLTAEIAVRRINEEYVCYKVVPLDAVAPLLNPELQEFYK